MSARSRHRARKVAFARHGRLKRQSVWASVLGFVAIALAVVLVSGASIAAIAVNRLQGNISTVTLQGQESDPVQAPAGIGSFEGGFNLLIVGSDQCVDPAGCVDRTEKLNDVTMLVHVAADQRSAVAVSFPRDLLTRIPSCPLEDGSGNSGAVSSQQINVSYSIGGLPCTVLTVEALTGLDIPYAGMMTFEGVQEMSTAIGGVDVCVDGPIKDPNSGLDLPEAGTYTLEGAQALAFLRTRYGVGDGSDLGRISSQQVFLSSMVRKIKDEGTLTDIPKLFSLADAATRNMTLSDNLASGTTLVSMALVLRNIPLESITFVQYPTAGLAGSGRVVPLRTEAAELIAKLEADEPFTLDSGTGAGSVVDPNAPVASPAPSAPVDPSAPADPSASPSGEDPGVLGGVLGQTAAEYTCSVANN